MPNNTAQKARERERIDMHEDYELRYWTQKFGVTKRQLEAAVREVGTNAEDVAIELGK
jgi:hypothetical protein